MTAQDWAILITAISTNLVAVIGAFTLLYKQLKTNTEITEKNHLLMNSQKEAADTYQRQLVDALSEHSIQIPRDKSIKEPPTKPLPDINN